MIASCFELTDDLQLKPRDYESAVRGPRQADARLWLDLRAFDARELEQTLDQLGVQGLARRLCLESRDRPGFYPLRGLTFFVIPVHAGAENRHDVDHLAILWLEDRLLTFRDTASPLQDVVSPQESASWLPEGSIAGLVSAFMVALSLASLRRAIELRDATIALERRIDREPTSLGIRELSDERSELLTLGSVISGQLPVLEALIASSGAARTPEGTRERLACARANLQAAARTLESLEGRVEVMRSLLHANAQDSTNRRLGRLTILSVIFMPITLMAGIWGMNFELMPELAHPWGYPLALGSMLLVGAGLFFAFRSRGWLD